MSKSPNPSNTGRKRKPLEKDAGITGIARKSAGGGKPDTPSPETLSSGNQQELQLILEHSPISLGLIELTSPTEGKVHLVNRRMSEMFGYTIDEIPTVGDWWKKSFPDPAYRQQVMAEWTARLEQGRKAGGEIKPLEVIATAKDGSQVEVECRAASTGNYQVITFLDLTESRRAEAEMHLKQTALEASSNAIVITDARANIVWANKSFCAMTGYALPELIGRNPRILKSGKHDRKFYQNMWSTLRAGNPWEGELTNRRKDGRIYYEEMTITPCKNERGRTTHYIAIKQDITERKQLEAQSLRAQRMESIGTLAGGIAHDLNNVLSPILMSIGLLRLDETKPETVQLLDTVEKSVRHGSDLVRQVLEFARGVEGEMTVMNIHHLARDLRQIVSDTFPKNIHFQLETARNLSKVKADATQIHQVLMNLAVNARDAMPNGGNLRLTLKNVTLDECYASMNLDAQPGRYVLVSMEDSGAGIPETILERIFDPFFTTKEIGKGTGLGLSTTLTIVRSHGGFIKVYSELGKGTRFDIYFPASESGEYNTTEIKAKPSLSEGHGEKVLVVDDDEGIRNVAKRILERHNYQVLLASHGAEAVSLYAQRKNEIDVVLTDMAMPVMDGPATIRALRSIDPEVKLIACSGLDANYNLPGSHSLETIQFLSKPFTADRLLAAISNLIQEKHQN